ncbi:MAG TPA: DNA repair protein RadC [Thermoanaerobaculia bacterium]|nr:DNA repair protein RadC [Thermoanaerobaculia bacterium]
MFDMIADLPVKRRPRERLLQKGADKLSDAELIAILLGTGAEGKNAIYLASELLAKEGLAGLERRSIPELLRARGMGPAKVARLLAAFELTRRLTEVRSEDEDDEQFFRPDKLAQSLMRAYSHESQENLGALYLDSRHKILRRHDLFRGTIDHAVVSTREIVRHALQENATGIVLFHNHPSGNPQPSLEDIHFTRKAKSALELVDLKLVQHLIVGSSRYYEMVGRDV